MGIASKENEPRAKANQKPPQPVMAQRSLLSFFKPPTATNVPKAQEASSKPEQPKRVAAEESEIVQKIPESPSKKRPTHIEHRPKPSRASPTPGALESMDIDATEGNSDEELFNPAKRSVGFLLQKINW
jgi:hypothetical protein